MNEVSYTIQHILPVGCVETPNNTHTHTLEIKVAQGRVWTGRQAMERGLVDNSGGLFAALDLVTRLAKAEKSVRFYYYFTLHCIV